MHALKAIEPSEIAVLPSMLADCDGKGGAFIDECFKPGEERAGAQLEYAAQEVSTHSLFPFVRNGASSALLSPSRLSNGDPEAGSGRLELAGYGEWVRSARRAA
ncbi:hypothetical protein BHM03_00015316 [Ensete ventricosum]|nr:hypothetical protein BHM03_00015316 [Ensete ventricosum]